MEQKSLSFGDIEIGRDMPQVSPKPIIVVGLEEQEQFKDGKSLGMKLILNIRHPDNPDMQISKVKYEFNKKFKESGLWLNLDKDNRIPFNSALGHVLRYYKIPTVKDLLNKSLETTTDENGYLIIKAY